MGHRCCICGEGSGAEAGRRGRGGVYVWIVGRVGAGGPGAGAGQPVVRSTVPSWRTSRAGSPAWVSQAGAAAPLMIAAVLAMLASAQDAGGDADGAPAGPGWLAGRRVDDVMHRRAARGPGPDRRAGGRQAAGPDGHRLAVGVRAGGVIVGYPDPPAALGRLPGDGDVAAEADQDAAAQRRRRSGWRSGPTPTPWRSSRGRAARRGPAGRRAGWRRARRCASLGRRRPVDGESLAAGADLAEVAVVASGRQCLPAGRVDIAVGQLGRPQRLGDQRREQLADPRELAAG